LGAKKERYLPVEKYPYLLLRFYDTYIYYTYIWNLLALCSGSPAPSRRIIIRMTVTFQNENNIIVYTLERIISYTKSNHYIFLAQSIWWISSIIGLQQELIIYIDNLKSRSDIPIREATPQAKDMICKINISRRGKEVSVTPRDIQENSRLDNELGHIHPDRISEVHNTISITPRDIQENSRLDNQPGYIHPDRTSQVPNTIHDISDLQLSD